MLKLQPSKTLRGAVARPLGLGWKFMVEAVRRVGLIVVGSAASAVDPNADVFLLQV